MRNYKVMLTKRAKSDLLDIGDYITYTLLEAETARHFLQGIKKKVNSLKQMPGRGERIIDEILKIQDVRCVSYKNYYIFYQIVESEQLVLVLRVGYNRRNWREILYNIT